jgi:hypothetical protein
MKIIDKCSILLLSAFVATVLFVNIWTHAKYYEHSKVQILQTYYYGFVSTFFSSEYAFFSPDIIDGYAIVMLKKGADHQLTPTPLKFATREMNNKLFCVMHKFYQEEDVRNVFAYSLATRFFEQNPQTDSLYFTFSQYKLPTMAAYQKGARPVLEPFFIKEFSVNR